MATVFTASFLDTDISQQRVNLALSQTTPQFISNEEPFIAEFTTTVQLVSGYVLLIAVLILVVLECIELHYIRAFFHKQIKKT